MKKLIYALLIIPAIFAAACNQPKTETSETPADPSAVRTEIEKRVNDFNAATKAGSLDSLNDLTSDVLSYGHSNGDIQDKRGFVDSLAIKHWRFLEMQTTEPTINFHGNTAVVRQNLFGVHQKGTAEPGKLALGVLMVWKKDDAGKWELYARQGFKLMPPNDVPPAK